MSDIPFFLRECNNFPSPAYEILQGEDPPRTRRAFELAVSLEALLEIDDAAELLFGFLWTNHHHRYYEDHDEDDNHQYFAIWLSTDIYITDEEDEVDNPMFYSFSIRALVVDRHLDLCICHKEPTTAVEAEQSRSTNMSSASSHDCAIGSLLDVVMQLLANHKTIGYIHMFRGDETASNEPFTPSLHVLKTFVSAASSPRELDFELAGLALDQWRVITCNCNENVKLYYGHYDNISGKFEALIEAMNRNVCPSQLHLTFDAMTSDVFCEFLSALESTSSLKGLEINGLDWDSTIFISFCAAFARNQGLLRLELGKGWSELTLSDSQWEFAWTALSSHPTLRTLQFNVSFPESSVSPERDQIMIQYITRNTILCKFTFTRCCSFLYSKHAEEMIRPFLELNRFRPVVEDIKQESDSTRRQKLFTSTLLSARVSKRPSDRFFLLRENSNLLAELSWPDNVFLER